MINGELSVIMLRDNILSLILTSKGTVFMFCYNCGKKLSDDSKFCGHCGAVIESSTVKFETTQNVKSNTINYNQANISQREAFGLREYLNWKYGRGIEKSEGFLNSALKRIKDLKNSKNAEIITGKAKDFQYTVLAPIEKQSFETVFKALNIEESFDEVRLNDMLDTYYQRLYKMIYEKNQNFTLENLIDQMPKIIMKDLIRLKYMKPIMESKEKLITLLEQYPDKRYSSDLLLKVKNLETHLITIKMQNTNNLTSEECMLTMEEGKAFVIFYDTLLQLIEQVKVEQKDIEAYNDVIISKVEELKNRINALEKRIHSTYYYSKEFRDIFYSVKSFILQPLTKKNVSTEKLQEILADVDKDIIKLEQIYQTENEDVEKRYQHNKQLADNMTSKLEAVCQSGNDVKYSNKVTLMIDEIRILISAYERSGKELNVKHIEDNIDKLLEIRKTERNNILNTIQFYEYEIKKIKEYSIVYGKPNSNKLVNAFLKRRGLKG